MNGADATAPLLELHKLEVAYGGIQAVKGIDLASATASSSA